MWKYLVLWLTLGQNGQFLVLDTYIWVSTTCDFLGISTSQHPTIASEFKMFSDLSSTGDQWLSRGGPGGGGGGGRGHPGHWHQHGLQHTTQPWGDKLQNLVWLILYFRIYFCILRAYHWLLSFKTIISAEPWWSHAWNWQCWSRFCGAWPHYKASLPSLPSPRIRVLMIRVAYIIIWWQQQQKESDNAHQIGFLFLMQ